MTTKDEALRMALEAICGSGEFLFNWHDCEPNNEREVQAYIAALANNEKAFTAIREVLAQPEQEPVAWKTDDIELYVREDKFGFYNIPLYTHPAPQRKPLTDEEIDKLPWEPHEGNPMTFAEGLRYFARAIEAAHGIKE